ncbi:hypothetical protein Peur_043159 [Populus x canadensis]
MFSKKKLLKFKKQAVILNVNSLFSLAVFVGLVWNPTDPISCSPSPKIAEDFIAFHPSALALKQAIRIAKTSSHNHGNYLQMAELLLAHVNKNLVRVLGRLLKLGVLGCGGGHSLVILALLGYVSIVLCAFTR